MAKRIERSRFESGKAELPRKLGFLATEKVDYLSVTDRDGEYTVEIAASALSKLVKAKGELKTLKGEQKKLSTDQVEVLESERSAHAETRVALAKAERKLKALTKKLDEGSTAASSTKAQDSANSVESRVSSSTAKPPKTAKRPSADKDESVARSAEGDSDVGNGTTAQPAADGAAHLAQPTEEPKPPAKVSAKNPVAKAADAMDVSDTSPPAVMPQ